MEEFLGVLFCGGRGTRIQNLTSYISKSFIPVYDRPVFKFGLDLLTDSHSVDEIIILTNTENDKKLQQTGFRTIIQNDEKVTDMFSGWELIKEITGTSKNGVLIPSDNICEVSIDKLTAKFKESNADFLFSLHKISNRRKLAEMGSFNIQAGKFYYKDPEPQTEYGVIAPYIIGNRTSFRADENIFEDKRSIYVMHDGYWFDLGDYDSIAEANAWYCKNK